MLQPGYYSLKATSAGRHSEHQASLTSLAKAVGNESRVGGTGEGDERKSDVKTHGGILQDVDWEDSDSSGAFIVSGRLCQMSVFHHAGPPPMSVLLHRTGTFPKRFIPL